MKNNLDIEVTNSLSELFYLEEYGDKIQQVNPTYESKKPTSELRNSP